MNDDAGIVLLLLALAIGGLLLRYAWPRLASWRALALFALLTTVLAIACLVGGILTLIERDMRQALGTLPVRTTTAQVAAELGSSRVVISGRVSSANQGLRYPAYIDISDLAGDDGDTYDYYLRDLIIEMADGGTITIDRDTYDPRNWRETSAPLSRIIHVDVGDPIVATGYPYEPSYPFDTSSDLRLHLLGDIVFRGNIDEANEQLTPTVMREAQRLHYVGLAALAWAVIMLLAPLTALPRVLRHNRELTNQ